MNQYAEIGSDLGKIVDLQKVHRPSDTDSCNVLSPHRLVCTRKAGHRGIHVACGFKNVYEKWSKRKE